MNSLDVLLFVLKHEYGINQQNVASALRQHRDSLFPNALEPGVSSSSLTSHTKKTQFLFSANRRLFTVVASFLKAKLDLQFDGAADLDQYCQAILVDPNSSINYDKWTSKDRSKLLENKIEQDDLLGIWQMLSFSTFVDEDGDVETVPTNQIRSALCLMKIHEKKEKSSEKRFRLRLFSIGVDTQWEGSADVGDRFLYARLRETSESAFLGERAYYIFDIPEFHRPQSNVGMHVLKGYMMTIVMGGLSPIHIFSGRVVMRKLPGLTEKYGTNEGKFRMDFAALRERYCTRKRIHDLVEVRTYNKTNEELFRLNLLVAQLRMPTRNGALESNFMTIVDLKNS